MTALPLHRHRTTTPPTNHGAYYCGMCWTPPGDQHTGWCPETAHTNRPRLAYPADARIFRGLLIAVPAGAAVYAALFALIGAIA